MFDIKGMVSDFIFHISPYWNLSPLYFFNYRNHIVKLRDKSTRSDICTYINYTLHIQRLTITDTEIIKPTRDIYSRLPNYRSYLFNLRYFASSHYSIFSLLASF